MAWEWSHSEEAYQNARENLSTLSPERLAEVWAEWMAARPAEDWGWIDPAFRPNLYRKHIKRARLYIRREQRDKLESEVWDFMSSHYGRTCDNGGFNAWACPFGCGCHTVSFNSAED